MSAQQRAAALIASTVADTGASTPLLISVGPKVAAALADAGLLVDDGTARLVALGKAVEIERSRFPESVSSHATYSHVACLDAIYRAAELTP